MLNGNARATVEPQSPLDRIDTVWFHGAGLGGDTWATLTTRHPRARTPDLPGHHAAPLTGEARVEAFADALDSNVVPGAVLIGHSLGGMVALELAARRASDVRGLVLIEAVPTIRDRLAGRVAAVLAKTLFSAIPKPWLAALTAFGQSSETKDMLHRQITRMHKSGLNAALQASARYDGRPRLKQVTAPTLVIVGDKNTATHRGATLMAEGIENAQIVTLPGGHMLHTDNPLGLKRCIEDFLLQRVLTDTPSSREEQDPALK
ncbi:MAG: alpha/beta hydrolase [Pseudomonadota bacterium]